ncbi:MAG: ATP-grasp domain-containing protein [Cyanobacteria bacterium P01_A01_bin.15]
MKIFNHDITASTLDNYSGVHLFSGRALGLSSPHDRVQLHPELKADWFDIQAHYARVGLDHSRDIIWDVDFELLAQYPGYEPSVYFFGHALHQDSAYQHLFSQLDSDWGNVVSYINSKNNFMDLAAHLGVRVPETYRFSQRGDLGSLEAFPYPCYVKRAISDHGVGIFRCENSADLLEAVEQFPKDKAFQVQEEVQASTFLNLQYRVTAEGLQRSLVSEQILDGCVHGGNRYPTEHQPWDMVEPMAQWMVERGMKGTFAFDVAVVETPDGPIYLAIECNPRFNGSSYPTEIAEQLDVTAWRSETVHTHHRRLADLDLESLEFDPVTKTGVVLVNWGTIQTGKLAVLVAGDRAQQNALSQAMQRQWSSQAALVS